MKTLNEIRTILRQQGDIVAEKYGIAIVGVFGSYVRGEQDSQSDLDLLMEKLRLRCCSLGLCTRDRSGTAGNASQDSQTNHSS